MRRDGNQLGDFLRASRGRVSPHEVGLPQPSMARRVAGLRREEVAVLASVSVDYYTRLEQGRERNPSPQLVAAIARALKLNPDASAHLHRLSGLGGPTPGESGEMRVHDALLQLLGGFPRAAAYVLGPAFDILATNALADALLAPFGDERSMLRILFSHPEARTVFAEWPEVARAAVHALRLNAGRFPDNARIRAIIQELAVYPDFVTLWEQQAAQGLTRKFKVFVHPEAGRVELTYQTFDVADAPGQQLLVGTPAPGSASEAALASLLGDGVVR